MGAADSKQRVEVRLREYDNVQVVVSYKQLEMLRVLQREFSSEVSGTLYFNTKFELKAFEIRTDNDACSSTSSSGWKIFFHTHPAETAKKYGIELYSPPSVEDVMQIYERSLKFAPETLSEQLGEISIIFANEGVYILQVDRKRFQASAYGTMSDDEQIRALHTEFNPMLVRGFKEGMGTFEQVLQQICKEVSDQFGFRMMFYSWTRIQKSGLVLNTNEYFIGETLDTSTAN